jgi:hypothetical protein
MQQICKVFPNSQTLEISASLHWVWAIEDLPNCDPKKRGERRAKKEKTKNKKPEEGLGTQRREEEAWCLKNDLS